MKKIIAILLVNFASFFFATNSIAETDEYILSEEELDIIYNDVKRNVNKKETTKKPNSNLSYDLQFGILSNAYDIGKSGQRQSEGFYLQLAFKRDQNSSIFIQVESSNIFLNKNTSAAAITHAGIGGTLSISASPVYFLLMLGSGTVTLPAVPNGDKVTVISSTAPVIDVGLIWIIGEQDRNPSFAVRAIYRNQKMQKSVPIDGNNAIGVRSLNSINYSLSLDYKF